MMKYFLGSALETPVVQTPMETTSQAVPEDSIVESQLIPMNYLVAKDSEINLPFDDSGPSFLTVPAPAPEMLLAYQNKANLYFNSLMGAQDVYFKAYTTNSVTTPVQINGSHPENLQNYLKDASRSKLLDGKRSVRHYSWYPSKKDTDIFGQLNAKLDNRFAFSLGTGETAYDSHLIEHPTIFMDIIPASYSIFSYWKKSVQITKISDLIDNISLHIGGTLVDSIHGNQLEYVMNKYGLNWTYVNGHLMLPLPFDLFWDRHALPFSQLKYHEVVFKVEINSQMLASVHNMQLRMDKYMIENYKGVKDGLEYALKKSQYHSQVLTPLLSECPCNFNHPITELYFHFTDASGQTILEPCFDQVKLQFNETTHETYNANDLISESPLSSNGLYKIDFGQNETINFSRVGNTYLDFTGLKATPGLTIHLGAMSRNIGRQMSGMFGLAFSN
jgi:hypothetical protein